VASELVTLTELMGKPEFVPLKRIEREAQRLILDHLRKRREESDLFPVTAEDLVALYDDISHLGAGVEGVTFFSVGVRPTVQISPELSQATNQNRYKSTLAHELGHVVLHDPMFQLRRADGLFGSLQQAFSVSFRDGAVSDSQADLYESQAWHFCRCLLMPPSEVFQLVTKALGDELSEIWRESELGQQIISSSARTFGVSEALARIHLTKIGAITADRPAPNLFS
jgi:hypothetical protein